MKNVTRSICTVTLAWLVGSCGGGDGVVGPPPSTTDSITISAATGTLVPGASLSLSATARDRSGNALSRVLAWSSSDPSKATVSSSGMVAGVAPGTATITAAVDGKSATSMVTVLDGGVVSSAGATLDLRSGAVQIVVPADALVSTTGLSVVPSAAYVNDSRVVKNTPFEFGPTGTAFAKPVTIRIKYQATDLPQGTEEPALQLHLSTPTGWQAIEGSVVDLTAKTVTAQVSHFSVYAILTPLPVAAVMIRSPPDKPIVDGVSTLVVGDNEQLTAALTDAQGAPLANRVVTWATTNGAVASVTADGLVTAVSPGTTTISASAGGVTSSVTVTVTPVPVAAVAVSLSSAAMQVGQQSQATALVTDAAGRTLTDRAIAWSSDNASVVTVGASTGVVSAVGAGSANITATSEGRTGSASITVTPIPIAALTLSAVTTPMVLGQAQQIVAAPKDAGGNTLSGRTVNWTSSNPAVLSVGSATSVSTSTGATVTVTAAGVGTAIVTATSESAPGAATPVITVSPVPVGTVEVTPASVSLVLGITPTQQLTATLKDANQNVLTGRQVVWSSSAPGVATVDANGFVTAVGSGGTTITATIEGKTATAQVTVSPTPVATITVSLAPGSITAVGSSQATAATKDANGGVLTGRAITWSSSNEAVATVSSQGVVAGVAVGTASIVAASEGKTGNATITVTPAPVETITVSPTSVTLVDGSTQQLTPILKDAHQNVLAGRTIDWSTSAPAVATVSANGLISALTPGIATIVAESEGKIATVTVTVTPIPVASVTVALASGTVIAGQTTQATATTLDGNSNTLTGRVITWTSDAPGIATVSATGLVTSVAVGSAHIIATSETRSGQATVTVAPVPVATVTVDPASANVILGATQQLVATTKDGGGNTLSGRAVAWSSDNPSVASVDATSGLVSAHAMGPATITALSEGKTGTASITVIPVPVASVTVSLSPNPITAVGTSQATAATLDRNGGALTGRVVAWSSSNPAVATVSAAGVVTAVAEGTANIVATSEGKSGSAPITITPAPVATVTVTPPSASIFQGETDQLAVTLKDAHNAVLSGRTVTWSSSNPSVAAVSASGLVTAGVPGTATITATSESQTGTASITVSMVPVSTVAVTLTASTINVGQNTQASAVLRDADGNILTGRTITWASDNPGIATVSNNGVVTAVAVGTAHISGASGGKTGSAPLTVTPIPVASVNVSLASPIQIGQTTQATAIVRDANNNVLPGRVITWNSDNPAIANVSTTGVVTAIAAGSANIIGTSEGVNGPASVTVIPVPVASLTLSAPTTPVLLGQTQQLTAIPKDGSGSPLTGRTVKWVSSDPAILSVSVASSVSTLSGATITVTAAGLGTATITASSESAPPASTPGITVNPIPVATVTVSPASASLALGVTPTQQLTAVTQDANGNVLSGRLVTWTSSNPAAATVNASGLVTAVGGGATTITATSETRTGTSSITVTVPVATVNVAPSAVTLPVNATHQLVATTNDLNGNALSGRLVTWSSSDPARAAVSASGLVTAVAVGPAVITATSEGKTGTSSITVTPIPVNSVSVALSTTTIQIGQTTQATATTFDASNNVLTGRAVTWSSGNPAIATVSASGLVTAIAQGATTIIATSEGKSGSATVTVIPVPVGSVTVNPASATVIMGATQQLSAETRDANNVVVTGRSVSWSSSNNAVASVTTNGLVTAVSVGGATITATSEGKSGTSSITVVPVPVASVSVTLTPNSITAVGTSQATATTRDANGGVLTGRAVTWSSSNNAVATVSAQGLITAVAVGTTSITATSEGKSGNATLTVTAAPVATVTVIPPSAILFQGETEQLAVTLKDAHDNVLSGRTVTWSSSNTSVATVSTTGLVTAIVPGTATITALSEGQSGTSSITVSLVPVASVTVTLAAGTITDAQSTQASATLRDAGGNVLTGRTITWSSDNNAVATVSPTGVVTPVAPGSTQIRATSGGQTGSAALTVIPRVSTVTVTPPSANVVIGTTLQLTAETRDAGSNVLTGRTVAWSSSDPSVAGVSATGLVTANALGSVTITATSEGKTGTSSITVIQVPVAIVTVSLTATTITVGQTTQATATTRDAAANILTGRSVTWSSGNTAVATVSGTGVVTSVGTGTTQIIAMSEGKTGSATLIVNPAPVASVALSAPATPMTVSGTQVLTATPKDASGNSLSGRTVNWVSSNTAVLTVSAATSVSSTSGATIIVTAVGLGSATISASSESAPGVTTPTITVNPVPVATVAVTPPTANLVLGITPTQQLTAVTKDANGNTLTGRIVTWSSSNTTIATVSASGLVTAVAAGPATITATSEGKTGTSSVTVSAAPVATVTLSAPATPMIVGATQQLTAVTKDANGNTLTGRTVTWVSSNTAVLTVSASGSPATVTAVAVGTATITATSESVSSNPTPAITVNPVPVATVTVNPTTASLILGITPTRQLAAVTTDVNGNVLTGRTVTWNSSNPAAATVSVAGLVTAVAPGTATITATSEGQSGTSSITVTVAPVASVNVSAPATPMIVGGTQQLTATTRDANGNVLTGRAITWVSSNTSVLTVGSSGSPVTVTAVAVGTATITATSESVSSAPTPAITVNPVPVATVTVTPAAANLVLGITPTQQLTAVTKDSNGNVLTGRVVTWNSSNPAAATVSSTGLVTAVAPGSATITATSETRSGTSSITVTLAPVASVTLSPPATPMVVGGTQQLTATTRDANGNVLTGRTITWVSSSTAVLTVSASGSPATVTAVAVGTATITATSETVSSAPTPTITVNPVPVATVTVTPPTANLVLGITPTQQLTVVTKDANGNTLTGRIVTWSSSNTTIATVSASGLVTAVAAGPATITATSEGQTGTSAITVSVAPVASVTVSLSPSSITAVGTSQATATTLDANGSTLTGRVVTWSSDNTAVATVSATTGLVTAVAVGTANIVATSEGKTGSALLTVTAAPVATVTVSAPITPMIAGQTQQLTATTRDAHGNVLTGRVITWVSSSTSVLTVSASGSPATVTAVAPGTATITAMSESVSSTPTPAITVNPVPVATVTVSPTTATLVLGITPTQQMTAVTKDASGNILTGRLVTWSSSNDAAATVNSSGLATAVGPGTATMTATSEGQTGTSSITVTLAPVATVTVTPTQVTLVLGITPTQQLTAVTKDSNGNVLTGRTVSWSSSNPAAATVDGTGLVTAVAAGSTTISAASEGQSGTSSITVTPAPVTTVTLSAPTTPVIVGESQVLTATPKDANGNTLSGRTVNWVSSDPAILTVSSASSISTASGATINVTAAGVGTATITATSESAPGVATPAITVNPVPVASVTVSPATATLVLGITPTQQLTAVTKDANDNVLSGRLVTWESNNTAAATVDANGLVTAVAAGNATITASSEGQSGTSSITVTVAPVATVAVSAPTTPMVVGGTQQLTAVTKDANGTTLTGRTISWTSSNTSVLTVSASGSPATVTAVGEGTATITATSESVNSSPTPTITVNPAPVAMVTLSTPSGPMTVGGTQVLTATPKDANGNPLSDRTVNWVSSNSAVLMVSAPSSVSTSSGATVTLTAVGSGTATITATSESAPPATTPGITVDLPATTATLLKRSTANPRYFENASGQIVYLTGSHTWSNLQDNGTVDPPTTFNYSAYLDFLENHNHNFFRLWAWEQSKWTAEIAADYWITPGPFKRTGPGVALDGKPQFDLTQFNQAYFDRLRSRVLDARARGIYVSVMLFDGWSVGTKGNSDLNNPWRGHPFNAANNINGIDGDTDADGNGLESQTLSNSAVTAFQEAYVRKVIDAVNDLDNVLYEIDNEGDPSSKAWQYHMIQVIRDYESTKAKQHPIGMTPMYPDGLDDDLFASDADWISPTGDPDAPKTSAGSKVLISDTDHLCGICGTVSWIWKAFAKGQNPILMDGYDGAAIGLGAADYNQSDPIWNKIRTNMGYARSYALRMNLATAVPHGDKVLEINGGFVPTGYCLATPGSQYLVFIPGGGNVTLNLSEVTGTLTVEWFNPATGVATPGGTVSGGPNQILTAPFSGDAVLFLH